MSELSLATTCPEFHELPTIALNFLDPPTNCPLFFPPYVVYIAGESDPGAQRNCDRLDLLLVFDVGETATGVSIFRLDGGEHVAVQHTLMEWTTPFAMTISAVGRNQRCCSGAFQPTIIDLNTASNPCE